jgi:hypothetical protein
VEICQKPKMNDKKSIHSSQSVQSLHLWWVTNWWVSLVAHAEGVVIRSTPTGKLRLLVVTSVGLVHRLAPAINTGIKGPYQSGNGMRQNTSLVPVLYRSPYHIYTCLIPAQKHSWTQHQDQT